MSDSKIKAFYKSYKIFVILIIISLIAILIIWVPSIWIPRFSFSLFITWVILVPFIIALIIVMAIYKSSGYRKLVYDRIRRPDFVRLAYVRSITGKILLNKQTTEPFIGKWVLLGGYVAKEEKALPKTIGKKKKYSKGRASYEEGFEVPRETISRRVKVLTKDKLVLTTARLIAWTIDNDIDYESDLLSKGYIPAHDDVYEVFKKEGKAEIEDTDITETTNLKWFDLEELKSNNDILDTIKELVVYVETIKLKKCNGYRYPKYWEIDESYLREICIDSGLWPPP